MAEENVLYRVSFNQRGKLYEIYAKYISEDSLIGFIEVEEPVFSDSSDSLLVDPGEEKLRLEFKGVKRFYIPMHHVVRIDEVCKKGTAKIRDIDDKKTNVSHLPTNYNYTRTDRE